MPLQRPRAAFEPIPPDIDVPSLVESTPNFEFVVRIPYDAIDEQGLDRFEKLVLLHVVIGGKPLVVEGYQNRLERWTFSEQWLLDNMASKTENARDLTKKTNLPLSIGHYLKSMPLLTDHWTPENYKEPERQRIYLKDIDCPDLWHEKVKELIPPFLFYQNESTGELGGTGASLEPNPHGPGMRMGKAIARAGDLMSNLPVEMRADNLMCYIGHEGTYTPAHQEMCASLGHNIMVEASNGSMEHGKVTKPGSSIWFMTESKDRHLVSEYWSSVLGHAIEIEDHFAQINAWKAAPFKTYVVEQRVGDFILIPPLAAHQVWNRGTRTMKVAWNRTTPETLELALNEALARARFVCRDEQYKNKAIVFFSLERYSALLRTVEEQKLTSSKIRQLQKDFCRLFLLYTRIVVSESFLDSVKGNSVEHLPFEGNVTCSYCRCNIFNRFLTCPSCVGKLVNGDDDTYDICMECYAMGRSCACITRLKWVEQFDWKELLDKHELWRKQILKFAEGDKKLYNPFEEARAETGKRPLAEICHQELKRRQRSSITKPVKASSKESTGKIRSDDDRPRKKRKMHQSEKWKKENKRCHICKAFEPTWKLAECKCKQCYCYGSLFRAFDIMPQTVMEQLEWKCPKCLKNCSCGGCRRDPRMTPYQPKGLAPGHDTKRIADPRSVELLVDFSHSNMGWLKKAGDGQGFDSHRLRRHQEEADFAKEHTLRLLEERDKNAGTNGNFVENEDQVLLEYGDIPIDPALAGAGGGYWEPSCDGDLPSWQNNGTDPNGIRFEYSEEANGSNEPILHSASLHNGQSGAPGATDGQEINEDFQNTYAVTQPYGMSVSAGQAESSQQENGHLTQDKEPTALAIIQSDILVLGASFTTPKTVSDKPRKDKNKQDAEFAPSRRRRMKGVKPPCGREQTRRKKEVNYFEDSDVPFDD